MKLIGVLALTALSSVGCGGGDGPGLVGQWQFTASDTAGASITFKDDGTYVAQEIQITNVVTDGSGNPVSVSANDQEEAGTYVEDGWSITFTPASSSCSGSDPAYTLTYAFSGDSLVLSSPGHVTTFVRSSASPPGVTYSVATGCFDPSGAFTASAVMPVTAAVNAAPIGKWECSAGRADLTIAGDGSYSTPAGAGTYTVSDGQLAFSPGLDGFCQLTGGAFSFSVSSSTPDLTGAVLRLYASGQVCPLDHVP